MNAVEKLAAKNSVNKFICVGLDTDIEKIPRHLLTSKNPALEFNRAIITATYKHAAAYKVNFAFYEKDGVNGFKLLSDTLTLIPPDLPVIADVKRGDIGNTSGMYAKSVFDHFKFDAATLNPLMGKDSLQPFLNYKDKLNFILALTSNPGADDFEKLELNDGSFLYQKIIEKVNEWNDNNNCGIVFGATNSSELNENIKMFDRLAVLLPGVGAQGGSLPDVVNAFKKENRKNYLINVSRGIIYKSNGNDFAEQAEYELMRMNKQVQLIIDS
ncbi:orotidine 5'-phosphate decarboxylase [bacterium BMS3Abin03]|nr:orotidine 5'-phosphate decarboxylase [bacterium BMS3Abin03]